MDEEDNILTPAFTGMESKTQNSSGSSKCSSNLYLYSSYNDCLVLEGLPSNPTAWSESDVSTWLEKCGLKQCVAVFQGYFHANSMCSITLWGKCMLREWNRWQCSHGYQLWRSQNSGAYSQNETSIAVHQGDKEASVCSGDVATKILLCFAHRNREAAASKPTVPVVSDGSKRDLQNVTATLHLTVH